MSDNNDSKLEMHQQQQDPLLGPQPPAGPPSYNQATGLYPTVPGTYPAQGTYPTAQGTYPTAQGTYPTAQGTYPTAQGTYPTAQGTYPTGQDEKGSYPPAQGSFPSVPVTYTANPVDVQSPIVAMEREGVMTVCSQCHNQVVTSVNSSLNCSGIGWIIYSILCCWPFAFFVCCMDNFKTWKHTCPSCRNIIKEFTPETSGGTKCGLVCAVIISVICTVLIILFH